MKFPSQLRSLCLIGTLLLAPCALLHAQLTNGQDASYVLGQANFTTSTASNGQNGFTAPADVVFDNATGKIFVVDTVNNRILRFGSAAAVAGGSSAEAVIGQPNFTTYTAKTTQTGLNGPFGATMDSAGNLWVADTGNNRVVAYANAATVASGSASAFIVLGQKDFLTGTTTTPSQYTMDGPTSVAVDSTGTLYVMDRTYNRVLRFANAATRSNGAFADGLFGQSNFLANGTGITQSTFGATPWAVAVDTMGNLWVADTTNNRVLRFASASTASVGSNATSVLGQADFTSGASSTSQTGFNGPVQLALDSLNRLYVTDTVNNRVLIFNNPSTSSFLSPAAVVIGQNNFASNGSGTTQSTLKAPFGLACSNTGYLWVADQGNNRVLSYAEISGMPSISTHPVKLSIRPGQTKRFSVNLMNSQSSDAYTLSLSVPKGTTSKASVLFYLNGTDVTSQLKSGTYETTGVLPANQQLSFSVKVKARATAIGQLKFTLSATSQTDSSVKATNISTIQVK